MSADVAATEESAPFEEVWVSFMQKSQGPDDDLPTDQMMQALRGYMSSSFSRSKDSTPASKDQMNWAFNS